MTMLMNNDAVANNNVINDSGRVFVNLNTCSVGSISDILTVIK